MPSLNEYGWTVLLIILFLRLALPEQSITRLVLFKIWLAIPLDLGRLLLRTVPGIYCDCFYYQIIFIRYFEVVLSIAYSRFQQFYNRIGGFLVKNQAEQ